LFSKVRYLVLIIIKGLIFKLCTARISVRVSQVPQSDVRAAAGIKQDVKDRGFGCKA